VRITGAAKLDVTLREIITTFGTDAVAAIRPDTFLFQDKPNSSLYLYYPTLGFAFRFDMNMSIGPAEIWDGCFSDDYPLFSVQVLEPSDLNTIILRGVYGTVTSTDEESAEQFIKNEVRPLHEKLKCVEG
jgi:hypothetical protein